MASSFYLNGIAIAGQGGTPRGLVKNDFKTYQPRIGFSYDLSGNGKTVLRGGFGTFFEREQGNDIYDIAGGAPFESTPSANNVELTNPSYNWQSGGAASTSAFPAGPEQLNHLLPGAWRGAVQPGRAARARSGAHPGHAICGQHCLAPEHLHCRSTTSRSALRCQFARPLVRYAHKRYRQCGSRPLARTYPGFNGMNQIANILTGSYNSFQAGLRQQNRHGLSFEVDYTYAHEIDDQVGSADLEHHQQSLEPEVRQGLRLSGSP